MFIKECLKEERENLGCQSFDRIIRVSWIVWWSQCNDDDHLNVEEAGRGECQRMQCEEHSPLVADFKAAGGQ